METTKIKNISINHKESEDNIQKNFWAAVGAGRWEPHTFDILDKHVKPDKVFLDIGAWNGTLSLYSAYLGAKCYAVEPDMAALGYMDSNMSLNPSIKHKIKVIEAAVSTSNGTVSIHTESEWGNSMSSMLDQGGKIQESMAVSSVTLDTLLSVMEINPADICLVKIDIEGAEYQLIPSMKHFMAYENPNIYLSLHPFWFPNFFSNTLAIADAIFPYYRVLLNGTKEINREQFVTEMCGMSGVDVLLQNKKKVGLVIPTYNRPEYLDKCMASIVKLNWKPDRIVIVDDQSSDQQATEAICSYQSHFDAAVIFKKQKDGVRGSVKLGTEHCFGRHGCDLVVVLDSDAIVKPEFIERLVTLHEEHGCISSGFNCSSANKPVLSTGDGVVFKGWCNGINMCYNKEEYDTYVAPTLAVEGNWDDNTSRAYQLAGKSFAVTTPSVVQHIGMVSAMGHYPPDVAADF